MSVDGKNQSDSPLTPYFSTVAPASPALCAQMPAHLTGAAEGSGSDLLVALGSTGTQIYLSSEQHSGSVVLSRSQTNKICPQRRWHQTSHREVQLAPELGFVPRSASVAPHWC